LGWPNFMKRSETAKVLKLIYDQQLVSRTELAKQAGAAPSHMTSMVRRLLKEDLVIEAGFAPSGGGRRKVLLQVNPNLTHLVGIDIGTANSRIVMADFLGNVQTAKTFPTEIARGQDFVLSKVHEEVRCVLEQNPRIKGIGVASSGVIDHATGTVLFWPKVSGWKNVPLKEILEREYGLPVAVEDSTRAMAIAHRRFGGEKRLDNFVFVSVGMGIGSAIFIDGRLYVGHKGLAGELGHTTIDETGDPCSCGNRGCLEVFASGSAIINRVKIGLQQKATSSLVDVVKDDDSQLSVENIVAAAHSQDRLSERVLSEAGTHLGTALASIVNLLDPQKIILGGAVPRAAQGLFLDPMLRALRARALQQSLNSLDIIVSPLGTEAAAVGAIIIIASQILSNYGELSSLASRQPVKSKSS